MTWPLIALSALAIFWLSLVVLLTVWPRTPNKSISQHAASSKNSFLFFTVIQVSMGLVLYAFVIKWFVPHFELSLLFTIVYTLTAGLQMVSAFIPDTVHGKKSNIHQRLANPFAIGMLLITVLLCLAPTITGWPKLLLYIVGGYMIYSAMLIIPKKGKPHLLKNYLFLQVIYIVLFQAAFLAVTFYG